MKVFDAAGIRNVALVGHSGAGKTQLASALLFDAGAVNRFGKVDEGTTVTDYDEEAIARKHTLAASLAYLEWNKQKINLIDTPGMGNFLTRRARRAARGRSRRRRRRRRLRRAGLDRESLGRGRRAASCPASSSCNRLDRERASLDARARVDAGRRSAATASPVQLPIGEEKEFKGVVDLVAMKAFTFADDESGKMTEGAVPDALRRRRASRRATALIEMVAEADDALMEKFFEHGTLTQEELTAGLGARDPRGQAVSRCSARPACGTSACSRSPTRCVTYVPSPAERPFPGTDARGEAGDARGRRQGAARALGLEDDRRSVRRTHHAVPRDLRHAEVRRDRPQRHARRAGALRPPASRMQGKTQTHVPELHAGDLGAVAKLKDTHTNDTLGDKNAGFTRAADHVPGAGARLRHRAEEPRRRGQDRPGDAAAARGGSVDRLRARPADARAAARRARASCTSRSRSPSCGAGSASR